MRLALLLAGAVLPLLLWAALPLASQGAGGGDRAAELQRRIDAKQRRVQVKRRTERVLTTDIARYSTRIGGLQKRISRLNGRLSAAQADLTRQRDLLETVQSQLRRERARLARLRVRLAQSRGLLARRMVELYEADRPDIVTVVLNSDGFAALLERTDFLRRISDNDRQIVGTVRRARDEATGSARALSDLERRRQSTTAAVIRRRDEIAGVQRQLVSTRRGYEQTRSAKRHALDATRVSRKQVQSEVRGLQVQQAKIERALRIAQPRNAPTLPATSTLAPQSAGGQFLWPVNGPITSPFCERRAWEACHPGLDIGVPEGTPIRAPASGKVVLMQPVAASGGYGNYTCLQHSATLSTCYAHQSRFGTTMGSSVQRGQVFGYVGNTGHSFGAHLHFEVRVNGSVVNPMNYL
jgi:murein DD-endopeptidase MepM/ murein hydrolase activator NlpD